MFFLSLLSAKVVEVKGAYSLHGWVLKPFGTVALFFGYTSLENLVKIIEKLLI